MAKIMIVDDSPADLRFMSEILRQTPHTVTQVQGSADVEVRASPTFRTSSCSTWSCRTATATRSCVP